MNQNHLQSPTFATRYGFYLSAFLLYLFALTPASAQEVFKSPSFDSYEIKGAPGSKLNFTLNGLPDPKVHGDKKGELEVQINWTLADNCGGPGIQFSEKVKIKATTHRFTTSHTLSKHDDRKQLRLNVSYLKPTGKEESPAKGFIAASKACAALSVRK
ncbi:MAG: hypothetical protein IPN76_13210 [Saprospiraceae bacterium]|nr:hypothetical protein [Saprospiraceae bacterium]